MQLLHVHVQEHVNTLYTLASVRNYGGQFQLLLKQLTTKMARSFEQSALASFESILYVSIIPSAAFYQNVVFFDMIPKNV